MILFVILKVAQWTALWNTLKDEFENEKNMSGVLNILGRE